MSSSRRIPSYSDGICNQKSKFRLQHLVAPHVESFDYFIQTGMHAVVADLASMEFTLPNGPTIRISYDSIKMLSPVVTDDKVAKTLTPREARERGLNYTGLLKVVMIVTIAGEPYRFEVSLGEFPVMVMSEKCHLRGLTGEQLIAKQEEENEVGGYFIVNGIERIIRLLQIPRRNIATALERSSFRKRGPNYTDKGVAMRCVRPDQSSITLTVHYLSTGTVSLRILMRKQEFLLPVVLVCRALSHITDKEFYERILQRDFENTFISTRLELLLRDAKQQGLATVTECRQYIGVNFRLSLNVPETYTDEQAGIFMIDKYLFVHTTSYDEKLECLLHMIRKLLCFAQDRCTPDNADALMNHELLLPGHLFTMLLREKLEGALVGMKVAMMKDARNNFEKLMENIASEQYLRKTIERCTSSIGTTARKFLSTGNLVTDSGMDLMQVSGFTIVAERLNAYRYMSHFQSVHRGQFFTTMKTTAVRKLLPESWGFMCPVHTPDGSPCGLLNHLARDCVIVAFPTTIKLPFSATGRIPSPAKEWLVGQDLRRFLVTLGVIPAGANQTDGQIIVDKTAITVQLDGIVIGGIPSHLVTRFVQTLRALKVGEGENNFPCLDPTMEIAHIPLTQHRGAYPGVYIFTDPGRMIRAVKHLASGRVEWVGPVEQVYLDIACLEEDLRTDTSHAEISPSTMLSHVASLTPYSDYNQSPRNMYQCQMGKQTMGTCVHAIRSRAENKMYRIQTPQAPIVQTSSQADYVMDAYPQGTNAIVAVIAYTGFDMEDAMILNKASYQRGFGHGSLYKTTIIDLEEQEKHHATAGETAVLRFSNYKGMIKPEGGGPPIIELYDKILGVDGFPGEGEHIAPGQNLCCMVDQLTGENHFVKHKEGEPAIVDCVRVLGTACTNRKPHCKKVSITLRYKRNPIIGDKFSSRHGQKGTLSVLWPQENMPFSESGMTPDVLINPHAFPSRMTIGMLIESIAGKSGALHGTFQDGTPFQFHEKDRIVDYIGEQLVTAGYSYYGSEPLYSGLSGNEMQAHIFIGVVFYQRLRHMVSDKSQVRSLGAVMAVTRQPVKGRKKHGGIRLGEMERDALLSHGASFCLQDRLMHCSDEHLAYVCSKCGGLLTVASGKLSGEAIGDGIEKGIDGHDRFVVQQMCSRCKSGKYVKAIFLPYVYRYLLVELAGMGVKVSMGLID